MGSCSHGKGCHSLLLVEGYDDVKLLNCKPCQSGCIVEEERIYKRVIAKEVSHRRVCHPRDMGVGVLPLKAVQNRGCPHDIAHGGVLENKDPDTHGPVILAPFTDSFKFTRFFTKVIYAVKLYHFYPFVMFYPQCAVRRVLRITIYVKKRVIFDIDGDKVLYFQPAMSDLRKKAAQLIVPRVDGNRLLEGGYLKQITALVDAG